MANKTYSGSCHCGRVRFEADLDLSQGSGRCNCSYCGKSRSWGVVIKPQAFRLLAGAEVLTDYRFGTRSGCYHFCQHCGLRPFGDGDVEALGGAFVTVNLACLDGVPPEEFAQIPIHYQDGAHNAWHQSPPVTSYL